MTNEHILTQLNALFDERDGQMNGRGESTWYAYQRKSWERLKNVRFPDRRHEDWKYTPVNRLLGQEAMALAAPDPSLDLDPVPGLDTHVIHFRNGTTDPAAWPSALRDAGISLHPWHEVFDDSRWRDIVDRWLPGEDADTGRAFDLLNAAFHTSALCIEIPPGTILDKPIEIRILHHAGIDSISSPLYFVRIGTGSSVTWFERFETAAGQPAGGEGLINSAGYFHLAPNAALTHVRWQHLPPLQRMVYKLAVRQERDSRIVSQLFDLGGQTIRNTIDIELEGSGTHTSLEGAYIATGQQSVTHQTRINHKVPHCESHEWFKGILDESGTAAFNGQVFVHQDAQKTNAYQQNDALVLSSHAVMNSKPQLEIFADDVRCSHGATIGQLNTQALFYLRSRGLDESSARQILKSAFLAPLVDHVSDERLKAYIGPKMGVAL